MPSGSKLDAIGIEEICRRIADGETYREIAASVGCSSSHVSNWLNDEAHPERREQSARALLASSEAWLDRGLSALIDADGESDARLNAEITRARAIAQECARRAAIRNPKYSDKQRLEHTGADGGPIKHEHGVSEATVELLKGIQE